MINDQHEIRIPYSLITMEIEWQLTMDEEKRELKYLSLWISEYQNEKSNNIWFRFQ